jgi:hypothetical protein
MSATTPMPGSPRTGPSAHDQEGGEREMGLEPTTACLEGRNSTRLSYSRVGCIVPHRHRRANVAAQPWWLLPHSDDIKDRTTHGNEACFSRTLRPHAPCPPHDSAGREQALLTAAAERSRSGTSPSCIDLACGTGSLYKLKGSSSDLDAAPHSAGVCLLFVPGLARCDWLPYPMALAR